MRVEINESCPECGGAMTSADVEFYDGELVICEICEYECGISVDEDGSHWLQEPDKAPTQTGDTQNK